jgi:hypothetical protein
MEIDVKLPEPKNPNYAATVVRVRKINTLDNCDNVVGLPLLGYQAITQKGVEEGALGVLFGAETQLSTEYASANNLHRHSDLNVDADKKGYLEDNRRIRALKFRGHRSDALFMPLSSLGYLGIDVSQLEEGDAFDHVDGREICRKYEIPRRPGRGHTVQTPRKKRVDEKLFPQHIDTVSFFRLPAPLVGEVVVTQKLHGTSVRIGHTLVERKLSWRDKVAKFFGVEVQRYEWAYVYGSRKVIKDPDNPFANEFYGTDIHTEVGQRLKGLLPKGCVVYGEIIGWVPGTDTPIQKGYTYRIPEGLAELYVYRVTQVNEDGQMVDLSWSAVKEFCDSLGIKVVPELATVSDPQEEWVNEWLDVRYADTYADVVPTDGSMVDEGICLRTEGVIPTIVKAKSPEFLRHETKMLDKGVEDIEANGE